MPVTRTLWNEILGESEIVSQSVNFDYHIMSIIEKVQQKVGTGFTSDSKHQPKMPGMDRVKIYLNNTKFFVCRN